MNKAGGRNQGETSTRHDERRFFGDLVRIFAG
jgi:hypothetical protein